MVSFLLYMASLADTAYASNIKEARPGEPAARKGSIFRHSLIFFLAFFFFLISKIDEMGIM